MRELNTIVIVNVLAMPSKGYEREAWSCEMSNRQHEYAKQFPWNGDPVMC